MIFLNQLCFVYGIKLAHASTVALLLGTTPIFIGLISLALGLEHLREARSGSAPRSRSAASR